MRFYPFILLLSLTGSVAFADDLIFDEPEQQLVKELSDIASQLADPKATPEDWQQGIESLHQHLDSKHSIDEEQGKRPHEAVVIPGGALAIRGVRTIQAEKGSSCQDYRKLVRRMDALYIQLKNELVRLDQALARADYAQFRILLANAGNYAAEIRSLNTRIDLNNRQKVEVMWPLPTNPLQDLKFYRETAFYAMPSRQGNPPKSVPRRFIERLGPGFWWTEDQFVIGRLLSSQLNQTPAETEIVDGKKLVMRFEDTSSGACFAPKPVSQSSSAWFSYSVDMYNCDEATCRIGDIAMIAIPEVPTFFYNN